MITGFGGKNCWCFKEWLEIDLKVNKNVPVEYRFSDVNVLPAGCFIGPNASGKSNALRVLAFIKEFCINSFNNKPNDEINFFSFFDNDNPSEFYLNFYINNDYKNEYHYESKLSVKKIISEVLYVKNDKNKNILFKRNNNKILINNLYESNTNVILRNNASFISTLYQYDIQKIEKIYNTISNIYTNISLFDTFNEPNEMYDSEYYYNNKKMLKRVEKEISRFDIGVKEIDTIKKRVTNRDKQIDAYFSIFSHEVIDGTKQLGIFQESYGTKALFSYLYNIFDALDKGGVFAYDELDCHLHPMIVKEIINYFLDEKINKNGAQLLFTTHNLNIINVLKKYNVFVFNKEKSESYCYRIDEIKNSNLLRNEKSLEDIYKLGLIGGIPNVKNK